VARYVPSVGIPIVCRARARRPAASNVVGMKRCIFGFERRRRMLGAASERSGRGKASDVTSVWNACRTNGDWNLRDAQHVRGEEVGATDLEPRMSRTSAWTVPSSVQLRSGSRK
jgi:hypothetical protein